MNYNVKNITVVSKSQYNVVIKYNTSAIDKKVRYEKLTYQQFKNLVQK